MNASENATPANWAVDAVEGGDTGARKLGAIKENANYFREARCPLPVRKRCLHRGPYRS